MTAKIMRSASFCEARVKVFDRAKSNDGAGACMYHPDLGYIGDNAETPCARWPELAAGEAGATEVVEQRNLSALGAGLLPADDCCYVSDCAPTLDIHALCTHTHTVSLSLSLSLCHTRTHTSSDHETTYSDTYRSPRPR
jgi:hypothetical protein